MNNFIKIGHKLVNINCIKEINYYNHTVYYTSPFDECYDEEMDKDDFISFLTELFGENSLEVNECERYIDVWEEEN